MDKQHYDEMLISLEELEIEGSIYNKNIYLFGHCSATEELASLLIERGHHPIAILDNNTAKHGNQYREIPIVAPEVIMDESAENTMVCIVSRAYAAMSGQLKKMGYKGQILKLVDYNSFADYSLSDETITRMKAREERGAALLNTIKKKYNNSFLFLCPFLALGDIYFCMSYLPYFLKKRNIERYVMCVIGNACGQVVRLFVDCPVEILSQKDMDETIQGALYTQDENIFIPHQDRPYVVNLYKALYVKLIPLEQIYCCGVFGLPIGTDPVKPVRFDVYPLLDEVEQGKSIILSPYAKSVTALDNKVWDQIVDWYKEKGYTCYTNVVGNEEPLDGTMPISPKISEMQSVVEWAGVFIGIRSGLCDVIRTANADMTALYPDYNYCDTKWKAIDMYSIPRWKNIVVKDDFVWKVN